MSDYRERSLGDILATALKRKENNMQIQRIMLKQERKVVTTVETTSFDPPIWMKMALRGEKINAIKWLKDNIHSLGGPLSLKQAKEIVETITNGIRTTTDVV